MTNILSNWMNHWKGITDGFDPVKVSQLRDDGKDTASTFITKGAGYDSQTTVYAVYRDNATGNFFPQHSAPDAFLREVMYFSALVPVKMLNTGTNAFLCLGKVLTAVDECRKHWSEKEFSKKGAFKPAYDHFNHIAKDGAALGVGYALYSYFPVITIVALTGALLASAYDPVKMCAHIQKFEKRWNVTPLNDGQAQELSIAEKVKHFCKGTFSLSRVVDLHCMGNRSEKVEGADKFDLVEEKKDQ